MLDLREQKITGISIDVELANNEDVVAAEHGLIKPRHVRRVSARGMVNSGITRLVIPEAFVQQLGLTSWSTTKACYADRPEVQRPIVQQVHLRYVGREGVFGAIVEPNGDSVVIGPIVLQDLDLIPDCTYTKLVARDPRQIITEIE